MDISERGFDPLHDLPYDLEDWALVENGIDLALRDRSESLFSLGNGFIGVRGGFEESLMAKAWERHPFI
ncbi:hypothetical protein [Iodidimonas gelatinilytica]|uniref:hypothetical protein n=1 Tax=Iodidimonas gelatinilytica TaxID=1236966 RepID=UPI001B2FF043|nr:hypothetical protein [Iodidimonas gelatinilytica]